jgi:hypothetical protein
MGVSDSWGPGEFFGRVTLGQLAAAVPEESLPAPSAPSPSTRDLGLLVCLYGVMLVLLLPSKFITPNPTLHTKRQTDDSWSIL